MERDRVDRHRKVAPPVTVRPRMSRRGSGHDRQCPQSIALREKAEKSTWNRKAILEVVGRTRM
jgi:hypothetical protein